MSVCPSVRVSVTRCYSIEPDKRIINFFTVGWPRHSSLFRTKRYGRRMQMGYEKSLFTTNISLYLGNDRPTRYTYNG